MADANLITTTVLSDAQIRIADFTLMFNEGIRVLREALGNTRLIAKEAGTTLKTFKATGTLENGEVAEGAVIPLSKYSIEAVPYKELTLRKWAKGTTAEAILTYGYNQAAEMTTGKMLRDVQKQIRTNLFAALAAGKTTATGAGLQATLAAIWGKMQTLYEDIDSNVEPVYFVNPLDIANYLGKANITTQERFGMQYIQDFLGLGTVMVSASVTAGKVYATAKSNLIGYYAPVAGAGLGEAFTFTTDELGLIGLHEEPNYRDMTAVDTMVAGIEFFPEYADGVVVGTITAEGV